MANSKYKSWVGGIAGSNKKRIKNCYNIGDVSTTAKSNSSCFTYSGGISGENEGEIEICYSIGDVAAANFSFSYAGGISGNNKGNINNCIAMNKELRGCFLDKICVNLENASVINCYANQEMLLHGNKDFNGNTNLNISLMNEKFFNRTGWNFDSIWTWDSTKNRPILDLTPQNTNKVSYYKKSVEITTSEKDVNIFKENIWKG